MPRVHSKQIVRRSDPGRTQHKTMWQAMRPMANILLRRVTKRRQLRSKTWRLSGPSVRRARPAAPPPLVNQRANIGRGVPASGRPPLENAILAIYARLPNGGVGLTVRGRCAMRAVCIMRNSCAKGINRSLLMGRLPVSIWRRCELRRELLTWTSRIPVRKRKHHHLLKLLKCCPQMYRRLRWIQTISRTIKVLSRLLTWDPALQLVLTPLQHPTHTNSSLHQTTIRSLPRHRHRGLDLESNHL